MIDMCLIAEIVILHIVELIEDAIVEHVGEHVLFSNQPIILNFGQLALRVYPTLTVVGEANPFMPGELDSEGLDATISCIVEHH